MTDSSLLGQPLKYLFNQLNLNTGLTGEAEKGKPQIVSGLAHNILQRQADDFLVKA
ncbi:hypothetical protein D3C81_2106010 [compost metagenome]